MKKLAELLNAGFTGIWLETVEPDEAQAEVAKLCQEQNLHCHHWDIDRGFDHNPDARDPLSALQEVRQANTVFVFHNFHRFLDNPVVVQALYNRIIQGKAERTFCVILSPIVQIPIELQKHLVVVEHDLPSEAQLRDIANELLQAKDATIPEPTITAATGLTRYEAEGAFALSLVRTKGKIDPEAIWEIKAGTVKKSGLMDMHRNGCNFAQLGGLNGLKAFCTKALSAQQHHPRGVLLLGLPGTGKSAFAKALGDELKRPTLLLDLGALMGSLVGQTEANMRQALKIADAMQPCILYVDEIEKSLAGATSEHQGDSGVSARMLGTLLTWLNDHTSDVFFIGTCNDVKTLPPAFTRAERFDAVFFFDLPSTAQRELIWDIYEKKYHLPETNRQGFPDDQWTGAEIKACCRLAAMLQIPLQDAARYIVPVAISSSEQVEALRKWAVNRCLDAETGTVYQPTQPIVLRRKVRHA